ncbi:MAG: hypothetical protein ACYCYI_09710 [Saccharofermentanales bacterium]
MLLKIFQYYVPAFVKKKIICDLNKVTASAFQCEIPEMKELSYNDRLLAYALFTDNQSQKIVKNNENFENTRNSLFEASYKIGDDFRKRFHISKNSDVIIASRLIYKILGIEMQADNDEIIIKECFFKNYYSGDTCKIISALDEGMAAGLSGGGKLEFYQRMTEGHNCCKARLSF